MATTATTGIRKAFRRAVTLGVTLVVFGGAGAAGLAGYAMIAERAERTTDTTAPVTTVTGCAPSCCAKMRADG